MKLSTTLLYWGLTWLAALFLAIMAANRINDSFTLSEDQQYALATSIYYGFVFVIIVGWSVICAIKDENL